MTFSLFFFFKLIDQPSPKFGTGSKLSRPTSSLIACQTRRPYCSFLIHYCLLPFSPHPLFPQHIMKTRHPVIKIFSFWFHFVSSLTVSLHPSGPRRLATCWSMAATSTLHHRHPITACKTCHASRHPLRRLTSTYKKSLCCAPQVFTAAAAALPHANPWPPRPPFTWGPPPSHGRNHSNAKRP
ncbi:hypothetical protein EDB86DRAFT_2901444 [Lactarius hatsudake]|nr:hypothetical protein EDB86DRAFT_2901444 [Lactarius hatsudake]